MTVRRWLRPWVPLIAGLALAACDRSRPAPSVPRDLAAAWSSYKVTFIHPDGYVLDRTRGRGEVTSEGQGYALLRAAWMRDSATFDRVFSWTHAHLARADGLYSWRWTPEGGGRVLDQNSAADADQEIAFALIVAAAENRPAYGLAARDLVNAIREHEAIAFDGGGWFPAAGNWAVQRRVINLSYFVPYAYPYFARLTGDESWNRAIDIGYDMLQSVQQLDGVRLLPDFVVVDARQHPALLMEDPQLRNQFSSDAMRIYWRTALDCTLHKRLRACADPMRVATLQGLLQRDGDLYSRYEVTGTPDGRIRSFSFYGAALPYLQLHAPALADSVRAHLGPVELKAATADPDRYYDANWIWFGVAADEGLLQSSTPPLAAAPGR